MVEDAGEGPRVGVVGGSRSDFPVLEKATMVLEALGIPCELRVVSAHRTPDLLFRYAETAQGRGIMTRACAAMTRWCFDELKLNRVEIQCARENARSRAVPMRLGFVQEGILRQAGTAEAGFVDHVVYGMLASEWPTTLAQNSTARG